MIDASRRGARRLKLGILSGELFDPEVTGIGGFGWAAKQVSRCFSSDPALGVDPVLVMAWTVPPAQSAGHSTMHGAPVIWRVPRAIDHVRRLRAERFDLLLAIDNLAAYRLCTWALPRTPVIYWMRDPWTPAIHATLATLRIPGDDTRPRGIAPRSLPSFRWDFRLSRGIGRRMLFASPARLVAARMQDSLGFTPRMAHLPNIIDVPDGPEGIPRTPRPSVVFVGRLDPVKRPWVAAAVASRMPEVDFHFLGRSHFSGPGSWQPGELPANLQLHGHVDGERKTHLIAGAWALLNTSIHEGLPVTFQEALACATPLVSCVDPDGVVSRFGVHLGEAPGDGLDLVPRAVDALRGLLSDAPLRERLGRDGRDWVTATHSRERFLAAFRDLCRDAGVLP